MAGSVPERPLAGGKLSVVCNQHRRRCYMTRDGGAFNLRHTANLSTATGERCGSQTFVLRWEYAANRATAVAEMTAELLGE